MNKWKNVRNSEKKELIIDLMIVAGAIVLAIFSLLLFFLKDTYLFLLPAVFFIGAGLNGLYAWILIRKKNIPGTILTAAAALLLLVMAVYKAINIWI